MNFLLLHGTGGGPEECWYPWLSEILESQGHKVIAPQFPTPDGQTLGNWLEIIEEENYWKHFDKNLVIIARSIGVPFALRLIERSPAKINVAFLVAGFYTDIGLPQFKPLVDSFIDHSFDWAKIRFNCTNFFVYNSDNDPIVPMEKGKQLAEKLNIDLKVVHGQEHIWFQQFLDILPDIKKISEM